MNSLFRIPAHLMEKDAYDIINGIDARLSQLKTMAWYALFFGRTGRGTWIKRPGLIYGARSIRLGDAVRIEEGVTLYCVRGSKERRYYGSILIGDRTFLNRNCNITAALGVSIGCDVAFGPNVFVCDFNHGYEELGVGRLQTALVSKGPIEIGDRCWVGANACIAGGVVLGHDCVVAANSVVMHSFPPYTVVAGAPAVAKRRLDESTGTWVSIAADKKQRWQKA